MADSGNFSKAYNTFQNALSDNYIPKTLLEALLNIGRKQAMCDEIAAMQENKTWELTHLP